MAGTRQPSRPATASPLRSRRFLPILLVLATGLLALVIAPFAGSLFAAAVFATVLQPLQCHVAAAFGGRSRVAAGTLVTSLTVIVLVPLGWLVTTVVQEVANGIDAAVTIVDDEGTNGLIAELPESLRPLGKRVVGLLPDGILPPLRPEPQADAEVGTNVEAAQVPANGDGTTLLANAARLAQAMITWLTNLLIETGGCSSRCSSCWCRDQHWRAG